MQVVTRMASPEPKKTKIDSLLEADMLTNLPQGVKEKILTYLSIKEAGRTSILSSKWRHTWSSIPKLDFSVFTLNLEDQDAKLEKLVDKVFLLHKGPIHKFDLCTGTVSLESYDRWIVNLSRNGIRELTLIGGRDHEINSSFFSCNALNSITLSNCILRVPLWFNGFNCLQTLELRLVSISADDLEKFVSSCPLLKNLEVHFVAKINFLKIRAANLLTLKIVGEFSDFQVCAPKLLSLCVWMDSNPQPFQQPGVNLTRVLGNVPELEKFEMDRDFLSYLCTGPSLEEFPFLTFNHLKKITFALDYLEEKEVAFVLALFRKAPQLQSLDIIVLLTEQRPASPIANFWETVVGEVSLFKQLKRVTICEFRAVDLALSFVKFILSSAPQLVTLIIGEDSEYEEDERMMFEQLLSFERASTKAKILFE